MAAPLAAQAPAASPAATFTADSERIRRLERALATEVDLGFEFALPRDVAEMVLDQTGLALDLGLLDTPRTTVTMPRARRTIEQVLDFVAPVFAGGWSVGADRLYLHSAHLGITQDFTELYDVESLAAHPHDGLALSSDVDRLIEAIQLAVDPPSWHDVYDGPRVKSLNVAGRMHLLIRQSYRNHRDIRKFLRSFLSAVDRMIVAARPHHFPGGKPAVAASWSGQMLTGMMHGERARLHYGYYSCWGCEEFEFEFHGNGTAKVSICEIRGHKSHFLGLLTLSRDERVQLNNWLNYVRSESHRTEVDREFVTIRWIADDEFLGNELLAIPYGDYLPVNCLPPRKLVKRFKDKRPDPRAVAPPGAAAALK
jgi:hypothetical protein